MLTRIVVGLFLLSLAAFVGLQTRDGFRSGVMPAVLSSRITPFTFDRAQVPAWFWGAAVLNLVLTAVLAASGVLILAVGVHQ